MTTPPPHLSTRVDQRVGDWAAANNVEVADTPDRHADDTRLRQVLARANVA